MGTKGTSSMMSYAEFLNSKRIAKTLSGFKPLWMPDFLFDFQKVLVDWAVRLGRCALLEDCGLGKTAQELVFCENVIRKTGGKCLILAPIAVSQQTVREGKKFGIEVHRSRNGQVYDGITITNYQQLSKFDPKDFAAVVCDESGILKGQDGKTRKLVTWFLHKVPYRLLATATPAPNDYMELGCSSEALGVMSRSRMLGTFFVNGGDQTQKWMLKPHAKKWFWQWMASWARAVRKPSDLGFENKGFDLPPLNVKQVVLRDPKAPRRGFLPEIATTLSAQREEKRRTLQLRCEKAASLVGKDEPAILWCQLNAEGDLLEKLIPDAIQVSGSDSDDEKEDKLNAFSMGKERVMVSKSSIAGHGLNWQHCADVIYFPSHSQEAFYQAIRRCWRFGQKKPVNCHLVYTEGEQSVVENMLRKEKQSVELYAGITREMNNAITVANERETKVEVELPSWLN
jgi:hypothetical protein